MGRDRPDVTMEIRRYLVEHEDRRREKWKRRVIEHVLSVKGPERAQRLIALCEALERRVSIGLLGAVAAAGELPEPELLSMSEPADQLIHELLHETCVRLARERDVRTFLRVFSECMRQSAYEASRSGNLNALCRFQGGQRFISEFLTVVGGTIDASMEFALDLQEVWRGGFGKGVVDTTVGLQLTTKAGGFPESFEQAGNAMSFLRASMGIDVKEDHAWKRWIEQLVNAAATSPAASDILWSLLEILAALAHEPIRDLFGAQRTPVDVQSWWKTLVAERPEVAQRLESSPEAMVAYEETLNPRLSLAGEHREVFERWFTRHVAVGQQNAEEGTRVLRWCAAHGEDLDQLYERRCQDILQRARYGLLPGGSDHVEIDIVPLRNVGIRAIAFHPDGYTFPDTGVHIFVRMETPHLWVYKTTLEGFELRLDPGCLIGHEHVDDIGEVAGLLALVVVDALHRIVVCDRPLRERKMRTDVTSARPTIDRGVITLEPCQFRRRAHLRRLQPGCHASPAAQQRAKAQMGWTLPPDKTFVQAHLRDGRIVYDLPTEATVVYTGEDLLDLGVGPAR